MARLASDHLGMDLLIVADRRDPVATLLAAEAKRHDRRMVAMEHEEAGRLFSIAGEAQETRILPDLPMLIRPTAPPIPNRDSDAAFLAGESMATLWTAATLARSPVLNRPSHRGFEAGWSSSGAITERRAGTDMAPEIYARAQTDAGPPDRRPWAVEDMRGRTRRWVGADTGNAPYRARPVIEDEAYERVIVLEGQAWRCTTLSLDGFDLEARSIAIAGNLGLGFVAVTWGLDPKLEQARLARIDPYPRVDQIIPVWEDLGPALIAALSC
ncbi:hypothetical protein [Hypericibacter sp.]|uniref:hypothetical protein n=1 Tax=Hypericibacter sp. TaxID=2705401 RepID=UPI003D6CC9CA